jgi:hypothetical protein
MLDIDPFKKIIDTPADRATVGRDERRAVAAGGADV